MILYAVQWHSAPLPPHEDENDLDWATWAGHDDYMDEEEANEAAREFDAAFDGAYLHRVVARRVEGPSVARAHGTPALANPSSIDDGTSTISGPIAPARGRAHRG